MMRLLFCSICSLFFSFPAASQQQDARYWLDRVVTAAHKLNYSGTFVFQSGAIAETSRITHLVDAGGVSERIEVLDGSPREVIRNNDEVKYFFPESRTLIIEKRSQLRNFPALLPAELGGLSDHYVIRKGTFGRVAGHESQSILLEPKDDLRYGHQLWVDVNSGLLLKSEVMNERNEPVETFTFTQLQIGGAIEREALKSRFAVQGRDWRVQNIHSSATHGEDANWQFRIKLPGFSKLAGMKRQGGKDMPESLHLVFSDGLAAISVFIEPFSSSSQMTDMDRASVGATTVYHRTVNGHLLVIMGEVPQATLKKFGDGIEPKRNHGK